MLRAQISHGDPLPDPWQFETNDPNFRKMTFVGYEGDHSQFAFRNPPSFKTLTTQVEFGLL